jgi:hypothetical protein
MQHLTEMALALDVRLNRLTLGLERIEFLIEPFLGRRPGVDRAPHRTPDGLFLSHRAAP